MSKFEYNAPQFVDFNAGMDNDDSDDADTFFGNVIGLFKNLPFRSFILSKIIHINLWDDRSILFTPRLNLNRLGLCMAKHVR